MPDINEHTRKVSVLVPAFNVERYIEDCLKSILKQTLTDFEIICINDGSTDSTSQILHRYAEEDHRIRVIDKINTGYGNTLNIGLQQARGEFVSIVESDDYIKGDMLEKLYAVAQEKKLDIVKANYGEVWSDQEKNKELTTVGARYGTVFRPLETPWSFYIPMINCVGIFSRAFLERFHIRFSETPGASHQDMGFWFQTLMYASRMSVVSDYFYMYRQDNACSSINNRGKRPLVMPDEYDFIREKLLAAPGKIREKAIPFYSHRRFGSCMYFLTQLAEEYQPQLLCRIASDFKRDINDNLFDNSRFTSNENEQLRQIMNAPVAYFCKSYGVNPASQPAEKWNDQIERRLADVQKELSQYRTALDNLEKSCVGGDSGLAAENPVKVSVIIPVYNTAPYLPQCLDSILSQTLESIEVICVDDGSADGSLEILCQYESKDSRMHVLRQAHQFQGAARNLGIRYAQGEYVYFMDSDDLLETDALEKLCAAAQKDSLDVIYFDGSTFTDGDRNSLDFLKYKDSYKRAKEYSDVFSGQDLFCLMQKDHCYRVSPCLQLIKMAHLRKYNLFFPEGIIYEDNYFNLICMLNAQRVSHRKTAYFKRRIRNDSTVTKKITAWNAYSYFLCGLKMAADAATLPLSKEAAAYAFHEVRACFNNVRNMLKCLPADGENDISVHFNPVEAGILHMMSLDGGKKQREDSYIMRKLSGALRCCQDHGIRYTAVYAVKRIVNRIKRCL